MNEISVGLTLLIVVNPPPFLTRALKEKSTLIESGTTTNNDEVFPVTTTMGTSTGTEMAVISNNGNKPEQVTCREGSEDKLLDLIVIIKEGKHDGREGTTLSPQNSDGKVFLDGKEAEHGIAIICTADYPVYLEFWVEDVYIGYFMRTDVEHFKCGPTGCFLFFQIGVWLTMDSLYFGEATKATFICSSASGTAQAEKRAVITHRDGKTQFEIQTIWKKKKNGVECRSECTTKMIMSLLFDWQMQSNVLKCIWENDLSCGADDEEKEYNLCLLQCWIALQLCLLLVNETLSLILYLGIFYYARTQIKPIRAQLRLEMMPH